MKPASSSLIAKAAILLPSMLGLCGCASHQHGPISIPTNRECFFEPYRQVFASVAPEKSPDRSLVQLGLPDTNKIVLWYVKSVGSTGSAEGPLTIKLGEDTVAQSDIRHYVNERHKTGRIEVSHLQPDTRYKVTLSGEGLEKQTVYAKTRPSGNEAFSFLFGSCFAPYRYETPKDRIKGPELASMWNFQARATDALEPKGMGNSQALGKRLSPPSPAFYLGMGDQLYVDPGASHRDANIAYLRGKRSDHLTGKVSEAPDYLNTLYRLHYALPPMDAAFRNMPAVLMWDDHDIRDGWGSHGDEGLPLWRAYYQHARDAFVAFQAARNPNFTNIVNANGWTPALEKVPIANDAPASKRQAEEMDFSFQYGQATFFVADGRSAKTTDALFLGAQRKRIKAWLENDALKDRPMVFVFSFPVPVTGNVGRLYQIGKHIRSGDQDDLHDRIHDADRQFLLDLFAEHFLAQDKHVLVILSGDVHYSGLQSLHHCRGGPVFGYEIISSGIAQTKYNSPGGFYGTVGGYPRGLSLKKGNNIWVQDHGMYSGPCFAELFISPPDGARHPKLGLEFYAASLEPQHRGNKDPEGHRIISARFKNGSPHLITDYEENKTRKWGRFTTSDLPGLLKRWSFGLD